MYVNIRASKNIDDVSILRGFWKLKLFEYQCSVGGLFGKSGLIGGFLSLNILVLSRRDLLESMLENCSFWFIYFIYELKMCAQKNFETSNYVNIDAFPALVNIVVHLSMKIWIVKNKYPNSTLLYCISIKISSIIYYFL